MKNFLSIAIFTLVVSLLYTGVAQLLPQKEDIPPPDVKLGSSIGPEALAEAGRTVFQSTCLQCHKLGEAGRGPDLGDIGSRAATRAAMRAAASGQAYQAPDYLFESLCKPGDYVVEGFGNIMPPQQAQLSGGQILAVVAYLQSLGAEPTVKGTDVDRVRRFGCDAGGSGAEGGAPAAAAAGPRQAIGSPETAFQKFGCGGCHAADDAERKMGPSLFNVGKRLSKGEIYESIFAPDAAVAPGDPPYPSGVMKQTLDGNGFYDQMTPADYQQLVDWLAAKKG